MEFVRTYNTIKDDKLNNARTKSFDKVIIDNKGTTLKQFMETAEKEIRFLKEENAKLKDELFDMKSKFTSSIDKLLENQETLLKKYSNLENTVNTAISITSSK